MLSKIHSDGTQLTMDWLQPLRAAGNIRGPHCRVQRELDAFRQAVGWQRSQWVCAHVRRTDLTIWQVLPLLMTDVIIGGVGRGVGSQPCSPAVQPLGQRGHAAHTSHATAGVLVLCLLGIAQARGIAAAPDLRPKFLRNPGVGRC